ncbi:MAG: chemotaxis protein CheC [Candidatus Bathyarchaeota archaeon]|nr:chemotaxis protein CheC [Candidatus Bathyarchaeota archaeon]
MTRKNMKTAASSKKDLEILLELGSIGAGHAATSLSEILQQPVTIDIPRICSVPPNVLPKLYHSRDMPATAVYIHLEEKLECHFLFIFEMPELKEITNMMALALSPNAREPSMELSATEELGNILIGSFLTAISDFTGINLVSAPPLLIGAPFDSIISDFVLKLSSTSGEAIVFDTCFKRVGGHYAPAQLMIFPSPELRELLIQKSNEIIDGKMEKGCNLELICAEKLAVEVDGSARRRRRQNT